MERGLIKDMVSCVNPPWVARVKLFSRTVARLGRWRLWKKSAGAMGGLIKRLAHWSVAQAKPGCGVPSQLSDGEASVEASDCFFNQALGGKEVDMSSCELNPVIVPIIEGSTHSEVCGDATDLQADLYPRPATGGALGGTVEHTSLVASVPVLPRALCATPPIKSGDRRDSCTGGYFDPTSVQWCTTHFTNTSGLIHRKRVFFSGKVVSQAMSSGTRREVRV
uniref:Uncharacterized protein n=1 Tax=Ananas comosus var. bracteatus TaxID=296719 RepID=A0A6V7NW68_ANACO|nr:unnamed protein product [Ananas comosus var. bracteatus]